MPKATQKVDQVVGANEKALEDAIIRHSEGAEGAAEAQSSVWLRGF
jgi:hypothetical protein